MVWKSPDGPLRIIECPAFNQLGVGIYLRATASRGALSPSAS
jgi:hypothetical protein